MEATRNGTDGRENRLLCLLPASDRERLLPKLALVFLHVKTVLFEPGQPVDAVYFPLDGVISLVTPLEDGAIVEVATVGNEGLVGVPAVLGGSLAVRAISQVAGRCLTMETGAFLNELAKGGPLARLVENYVQALFGQIAQAAACNRLHSNEERLSRWLLNEPRSYGHRPIPHHPGVSRSDARIPAGDGDAFRGHASEGWPHQVPPRSRRNH